jgi:hypothetical protein
MSRGLLSVSVDLEPRRWELEMNDWKLAPVALVALSAWRYREQERRPGSSNPSRALRRRVRRIAAASIQGLCSLLRVPTASP